MNLPFYIAKKYFFSGKVSNLIHLISGVSMTGIMVCAFALIVILSVFNGLEKLVISLYNRFDSDIRIELQEGKYFDINDAGFDSIRNLQGVYGVTGIIEEKLMVRHGNNQAVATIKGMDPVYLATTGMDTLVFRGYARLIQNNRPMAIVGLGIARQLDVNVFDDLSRLRMYLPRPGPVPVLRPDRGFNQKTIASGGIFSIQQEIDNEYIVVPLSFARELAERDSQFVTAVEVNISPDVSIKQLKTQITEITGPGFRVEDRLQQHAVLYRILQSERLAVYLILTFVLLVASFNMVGALLMLVIEKQKDMSVLATMGAGNKTLQKVFYWESLLLSGTGGITGLVLGTILCWIQMEYGLVKLGTPGTFVVDAYPVVLKWQDFLLVMATVFGIGLLSAVFPAMAVKKTGTETPR